MIKTLKDRREIFMTDMEGGGGQKFLAPCSILARYGTVLITKIYLKQINRESRTSG
jgi:hypothetical protein